MHSQFSTTVGNKPYLELKSQIQSLRFQLTRSEHFLGRSSDWADLWLPDEGWEAVSRKQARLCQEGENYRVFDGDGNQTSRNGIFHRQTRIDAVKGYLLDHGTELRIGQDPQNLVHLVYCNPASAGNSGYMPYQSLTLKNLHRWPVVLGRFRSIKYAFIELDAPAVSRRHALLTRSEPGVYVLEDQHSANGTYVNGERIEKPVNLQEGDIIQIGPFKLWLHNDILEQIS
jgi:pSer/pThr/pTyr-binding forkhead associated (FHA) protein